MSVRSFLDEAREMGAHLDDDHLQTSDFYRARNARWAFYRVERIAKGRPACRTVYRQTRPDWKHYPARDTVAPDPILDLLVARNWARNAPCDPAAQQRYGEVLQSVVSLVNLPADRRPGRDERARGADWKQAA